MSTFNWIEEHIPASSSDELHIRIPPPSVVERPSVGQQAFPYDGKSPVNSVKSNATNFSTPTQQNLSDLRSEQVHSTSLLHGAQDTRNDLLGDSMNGSLSRDTSKESNGFLDELAEFVNDSCLGRTSAFLILSIVILLIGRSIVAL
jgi:hypothetical protein